MIICRGLCALLLVVPASCAESRHVPDLPKATLDAIDGKVRPALAGYDALTIGLVRQGRIVLTRAYGKGRLDAAYEYASVSKPVTAAILLKLRQEGRIRSLDDNLWDYVPRFKGAMPDAYKDAPLTLRHLLSHQGGIPHNDEAPWVGTTLNLKSRPGTEHRYSTPGYGLLGMVIEAVTGTPYARALETYVAKPLGAPSLTAYDHFIAPGAFVTSTIEDLGRFALGMMADDYLPASVRVDELWKPLGHSYGLGWSIQDPGRDDMLVSHSGSNGRPRAYLLLKPRAKAAVVILAQKLPGQAVALDGLARELLGLLEAAPPGPAT